MSKKILFIVPQLPYPPHHGSSLRNYHLIRTLASHYTIDLLAFSVPENALAADNPLNRICRNIATVSQPTRSSALRILDTFRKRLPDMALRLECAQMRALVYEWAVEKRHQTEYDIVQVEGIEMAQYGLAIVDAFESLADAEQNTTGHSVKKINRPLFVFDDHNCEYLLQKRNALNDLRVPRRWPAAAYSVVQWQKLKWYEALICKKADAVSVVSPADRDALLTLVGEIDITVISNGVALNEYTSVLKGTSINASSENHAECEASYQLPPKKLLFVGKMDYRPNVDAVLWFANQVLPMIQQQDPSVHFEIVGINPHERLNPLRNRDGIIVVGQVKSIVPYLREATAYVIPLRVGGGTRFKALEAMAASMPIVSTRLGVEGIPVAHNQELLLADTPQTFADEVLRLLENSDEAEQLRRDLGTAGRHFVEEQYSWNTIIPRLEEIYTHIQK